MKLTTDKRKETLAISNLTPIEVDVILAIAEAPPIGGASASRKKTGNGTVTTTSYCA
jgi:hypothetical protein